MNGTPWRKRVELCDGRAVCYLGDCRKVLPALADPFTASVSDPPYGLKFMGKAWDHGVPGAAFWRAVSKRLLPGAPLLAFGGTRTFHRLMCGIEDAGLTIRDCLCWLYGSGIPKSHDISKAIDKAAGAERQTVGRKRVSRDFRTVGLESKRTMGIDKLCPGLKSSETTVDVTAPATDLAREWNGWGTTLKPAWEPIVLAMKPNDGTFAANAEAHGVAGLNVDGCRIEGPPWHRRNGKSGAGFNTGKFMGCAGCGEPTQQYGEREGAGGRWPANVVLDENAAAMLDEQAGFLKGIGLTGARGGGKGCTGDPVVFNGGWKPKSRWDSIVDNAGGGASRFFYCAKASRAERTDNGRVDNRHPTVKPLKLLTWLCRLVAPPKGGRILDPFMGSGTTALAALATGQRFCGIEIDEKYFDVACQRLADAGPLFTQTRTAAAPQEPTP